MARLPRRLAVLLTTLTCAATVLATGARAPALATSAPPVHHPSPGAVARPGVNLLLNPGAEAGAASAQGWDAVTIPGWQISTGLPAVARYGTAGFPPATGRWPAISGGQLFAGGAGGTARLWQRVPLRSADGSPVPGGTLPSPETS